MNKLSSSLFFLLISISTSAFCSVEDVDSLVARCAPTVHLDTMKAVMSVESTGHIFAIADAGPLSLPWSQRKHLVRSFFPSTVDEAVSIAEELKSKGHTFSMGVAQINDRNLAAYGLTIKDVFDPCKNIAVGGAILTDFYLKAQKKFTGFKILRAALSAYNSGSFERGDHDGYVDAVIRAGGKPIALTMTSQRLSNRKTPTVVQSVISKNNSSTHADGSGFGLSVVSYNDMNMKNIK